MPRKLDVPKHPRFKGFEAFAAREIFPRLAEMEGKRRRVVSRAKFIAIATGLIVLAVLVLGYFEIIGLFGVIALAILLVLGGAFAGGWPLMSFAESVDALVLAKTCQHLKLRHTSAQPRLPIDCFLAAGLLPQHDRCKLEDGIECDGPDLVFTAAEADLTSSRTDSDGKDEEYTVWRGLLIAVPAPNLSAARTALAEPATRRLNELARRLGREPPSLAAVEESVLLAIASDKNRFRGGSVFQPLDRAETLDTLLADVALLLELAEALRDALGPGAPPRLTKPA